MKRARSRCSPACPTPRSCNRSSAAVARSRKTDETGLSLLFAADPGGDSIQIRLSCANFRLGVVELIESVSWLNDVFLRQPLAIDAEKSVLAALAGAF